MVFDIALSEDFEVIINERSLLETVDGNEGLEQAIALRLTDKYYDLIGSGLENKNITNILEVEAKRVARSLDSLTELSSITVEYSDTEPETLEVEIMYNTGDSTIRTIN